MSIELISVLTFILNVFTGNLNDLEPVEDYLSFDESTMYLKCTGCFEPIESIRYYHWLPGPRIT